VPARGAEQDRVPGQKPPQEKKSCILAVLDLCAGNEKEVFLRDERRRGKGSFAPYNQKTMLAGGRAVSSFSEKRGKNCYSLGKRKSKDARASTEEKGQRIGGKKKGRSAEQSVAWSN